MASFELPSFIKPTIPVAPFTASIPDSEIESFKTLVKLSKLPPALYDTQHRKYGVTAEWMRTAKTTFETTFDWYLSNYLLQPSK
jgi:microsomal epoxide hydrolase